MISKATANNWRRLNTDAATRLTSRAGKGVRGLLRIF